jgi:YD repeat-containing protein
MTYAYCQAAGGTWQGYSIGCTGLPPGFSGNDATSTNNETLTVNTTDTTMSQWAPGANCGTSYVSNDTGWFTNLGASSCWGGGPQYKNNMLFHAARQRSYQFTSPQCTQTIGFEFLKFREVKCPVSWAQRVKPNGDLQCYIPGETECTKCGNPVSYISGAKTQEETDYVGAGNGALEFRRYYNSLGYYRTPGSLGGGPSGSDYWRHSYMRELIPVTGNPQLMAVLRRENGTLRHFDGSGKEILNRTGAADRLQLIAGVGYDLTLANYDVEHYSLSGRLTSITTRAGVTTALAYDTGGQLTTVTNSFGQALSFVYDIHGRLATLTLPDTTSAITYAYDDMDRPVSVTFADSTVRQYHYEDSNDGWLLSGITDESAIRYSTYTYDTAGRVAVSEHAGGAEQMTMYYGSADLNYVPTSATDALGMNHGAATTNVGGVFRVSSYYKAQAGTGSKSQLLEYDTQGNVSQILEFPMDNSGNRTKSTYVYDPVRNLETSRTEGLTQLGTTPDARTITTQWHPTFRQPSQISVYAGDTAAGVPKRVTSYTYDASGNTLTKTVTDTTVTPNVSRTWTYTYNSYGQVLTEDGPRTDVSDVTTYAYYSCTTGSQCGQLSTVTNAAGQVTSYNTYNPHEQVTQMTDPNGVVTTLAYDLRQRLTGRCVGGTLPTCTGGEKSSYEYWPTGLVKKVVMPDTSFVSYSYDAAHRLTAVTDGLGNHINYTLDAMGNRTATVTTTYVYNIDGNQTGVNAPLARNTVKDYDRLNRLKQVTDPASGVTQFGYDATDNLTAVIDPTTKATNYTYTGFGDLKTQTSPVTGLTTNVYDSGGNLGTSTDARNVVTAYSYDALNRVTSAAYTLSGNADQTISYTYDAGTNGKGRLTGASDANHSLTWQYDALGRVTSKSQMVSGINLSVSYGYVNAQLTTMTTPSGQAVIFGYTNNQVSSISVNGTTVLSGVAYEPFGPARTWTWGNATTEIRLHDTDGNVSLISALESSSYTLDNAFRITGISNASTPSASWTYGYDNLDRLTSANAAANISWTYDANGNRQTQLGAAAPVYPASNVTLNYNNRGRMISATDNGSSSYTYNALGQRIYKNGNSGNIVFMYDESGHLLGEYSNSGALIQETVWLGDIPVASIRPGSPAALYYVHADHLNTPKMITRPADSAVM